MSRAENINNDLSCGWPGRFLPNFSNSNRFYYPTVDVQEEDSSIYSAFSTNQKIQSFIDLTVIVIVFVAFFMVYTLLDPRIRGFHCNDTDIFNPIRHFKNNFIVKTK
jgi:hypothetical protein